MGAAENTLHIYVPARDELKLQEDDVAALRAFQLLVEVVLRMPVELHRPVLVMLPAAVRALHMKMILKTTMNQNNLSSESFPCFAVGEQKVLFY
jgi:hypothetical protein